MRKEIEINGCVEIPCEFSRSFAEKHLQKGGYRKEV